MTAAEIIAISAASTAALGGLIKLGTWLFGEQASRASGRRTDLTTIITRQDDEIKRLREQVEFEEVKCAKLIADLARRVELAEAARAQMEGVLYRMGWERSPEGRWRRNGEGEKP